MPDIDDLFNQAMLLQVNAVQNAALLLQLRRMWRQRRRPHQARRPKLMWVKTWLLRRDDLGHYNTLMRELEAEDPPAYRNFIRCDPLFFKELVERLAPRIRRKPNNWRKPLQPGLMVAITLRYLATGQSYHDLMFDFRVAHNTISNVVREVLQAIIDEYLDETIIFPTTQAAWEEIADQSLEFSQHNWCP